MKEFKLENYTGKVVMHCDTEKKADVFLKFLDAKGKTWVNAYSYDNGTNFTVFKKNTYYYFNEGVYSGLRQFETTGYIALQCLLNFIVK